MGLLELIVKTGIADAIASQLGGLKGNRNAIAETIENNVRRTIIKEHLNDPAYYEKMSALLDEIIRFRKEQADKYEEYLKRIAELAKQVDTGYAASTPPQLDTPGKRALYNNLKQPPRSDRAGEGPPEDSTYGNLALDLALRIDEAVKRVRPAGWRGVQTRENVIKATLFALLGKSEAEVERIFQIIKVQKEY
jgi:type I restriction enzyme R subunit